MDLLKRISFTPVLLGILIAICIPTLSYHIVRLGVHTGSSDVVRDYLLGVSFSLILLGCLCLLPICAEEKGALLTLWAVKIVVGLVVMLFYEFKFGGDAFGYYFAGKTPYMDWKVEFGNGTRNMQTFAYLFTRFLSTLGFSDTFHGLKIIFSFIGLFAIYMSYLVFKELRQQADLRVFYWIGLTPGILFWSSTLGKDPVNMLGCALFAYGAVKWLRSGEIKSFIWLVLGILVAMIIRIWSAAILIVPLTAVVIFSRGNWASKIVGAAFFGALLLFTLENAQKHLRVSSLEQAMERSSSTIKNFSDGGSRIEAPDLKTPKDFVKYLPIGLFTALFRPLPGEVRGAWGVAAGLESFVILLLFVRSGWIVRRKWFLDPALAWVILEIFFWGIIYGFTASTNMGTLVRYRLQVEPLMILFIAYATIEREKFLERT